MKASLALIGCLVLVFGLAHPLTCADKKIPYADSVPFIGIEEAAQSLKKAVCAVQIHADETRAGKPGWVSLGTGFLVGAERNVVLVVTCKHIVLAASKTGKPLHIGLDTEGGYRRFNCKVAYLDPAQDIAILAPQRRSDEEIKLQSVKFSEETFNDGSSLVEGRAVIIPGYPLSLGIEEDQNHPVIRFGIVAQFTGRDYFLLDGIASHGNSGSPVFSLKFDNNRLIGMVTSFQTDKINLFDENEKLSASLPYNSGLARCLTMKTILSAIKNAKY